MQIKKDRIVTLDYTLKDNDDNVIDSSNDGSFSYLHGASNIIPGLENALAGKTAGDELSVSIAPADAYGEHDAGNTQTVPRDMFPPDQAIEIGMQFHAQAPDGQPLMVKVIGVTETEITVDGNHPLAGMQLNFDVKVMNVRDASKEELEHGHAHGPGGHNHD